MLDQERQSLQKLRALVGTACEVLALWGVLLEHELCVIFVMLMPNVQRLLLCWTLEDLVRNAQEVEKSVQNDIYCVNFGNLNYVNQSPLNVRNVVPKKFKIKKWIVWQ